MFGLNSNDDTASPPTVHPDMPDTPVFDNTPASPPPLPEPPTLVRSAPPIPSHDKPDYMTDSTAPPAPSDDKPDYISNSSPPAMPGSDSSSQSPASDLPSEPPTSATASDQPAGALVDIKQQALQSLTPLVGQLDQTPEERFKTTMMLIQASDNADLVKKAYDAANEITDPKARAQALLDVVNEINYFTHNLNNPDEPQAS